METMLKGSKAGTTRPKIDLAETLRRRAGLEAAERSAIREGLPPRSEFARTVGEKYALGELTGEQGISEIVKYHRQRSGQ